MLAPLFLLCQKFNYSREAVNQYVCREVKIKEYQPNWIDRFEIRFV